jgi:hypothetical protein
MIGRGRRGWFLKNPRMTRHWGHGFASTFEELVESEKVVSIFTQESLFLKI